MKKLFIKKKNDSFAPEYLKGWREANEQFSVDKDTLFCDYEDDDEPGLHNVSHIYDWEWREL